jgi:hypothetical protein
MLQPPRELPLQPFPEGETGGRLQGGANLLPALQPGVGCRSPAQQPDSLTGAGAGLQATSSQGKGSC